MPSRRKQRNLPKPPPMSNTGKRMSITRKAMYGTAISCSSATTKLPARHYVGSKTTLYGSAAIMLQPTDNGVNVVWTGRENAWFEVAADRTTDIAREANGAMMLSVKLKINAAPTGDVAMGVGVSTVPVAKLLKAGDVTRTVPLSCFANSQDLAKTPGILHLATSGTLDISVYDVRLIETKTGATCPID